MVGLERTWPCLPYVDGINAENGLYRLVFNLLHTQKCVFRFWI